MHAPPNLEVTSTHCRYCPRGEVTLVQAVQLVTNAIAFCRDQGNALLLVNVTGLTGFADPLLEDRYWMVQDWADASKGAVIVAIVARPEHIDPAKFGVKAAADAGLAGDIFDSEPAALEWLLAQPQGPRA